MSFSKHAAAHPAAYFMMAAVETLVLPMFVVFVAWWFRPAYDLSNLFTVLIGLGALGFLIGAWIPDNDGRNGIVHKLSAYGAALLFMPAAALISTSPQIADIPRFISYGALTYMIFSLSLCLTVPKARRHYLYLQGGYILSFHILIVTATYIR